MRVLHVAGAVAPALGGPSTAALQMCQALARKGLQVSLLTTDLAERGSFAPFYRPKTLSREERQQLHHYDFKVTCFPATWPTRYAHSPQMRPTLETSIADADVVHVHTVYLWTSSAAADIARRMRIPYVIRPHGSFMPHLRHRNRLAKSIYHQLVGLPLWNRAAAIHYTSETEREQARDVGITAPAAVIPLGIDLQEFAELPARGTFRRRIGAGDGPLIVFLGRLAPRKGLDLLVTAFSRLAKRFPDAHLVLAGPDEFGFEETLRGTIHKLGLSDRVSLPGLVAGDDKRALLADTDLWVLPSYGENFGLAVVEALAAGCAVIVSDRVDIHEELRDMDACAVTPCDADSLAGAMKRLLDNAADREELSRRARAAATRFSWDSRIEPLIALYEAVCRAALPVPSSSSNQ
jgi:glycosyltransferase involved in cell wall biosynthesis